MIGNVVRKLRARVGFALLQAGVRVMGAANVIDIAGGDAKGVAPHPFEEEDEDDEEELPAGIPTVTLSPKAQAMREQARIEHRTPEEKAEPPLKGSLEERREKMRVRG